MKNEPHRRRVSEKLGVLVAIDRYENPQHNLNGCVNDLYDMKRTLQGMGVQLFTIINEDATKTNILKALKAMLSNSRLDASYVFYFSGHGTQVKDFSLDEYDGLDECLVPYDYPELIRDDEIRHIVADHRAAHTTIDFIFDCCHSGTGTRSLNDDGTPRYISSVDSWWMDAQPMLSGATSSEGLSLWAACRSGQTAKETQIDGITRGVFTSALTTALRDYPSCSRKELIKKVKVLKKYNQVPRLETNSRDRELKIFE